MNHRKAMIMNIFREIKRYITARDAAKYYSYPIRHNGMIRCPFHEDHTPSMKIDERFHCFGCGADGDVIQFVAMLFHLSNMEAAKKIIEDFHLPIDINNARDPPARTKAEVKQSPISSNPDVLHQETIQRVFHAYRVYLKNLTSWKEVFAPLSPKETIHPKYTEAVLEMDRVRFILETLAEGSEMDRARVIIDNRTEVIELEQRFAVDMLRK